ncbi:unnamed protein product [Rotaria sp. Silwood1]|nr:unnamed protein product [Rotaria sp. Silwood1]
MVEDLTNEINNATADERKILEERLNDISIRMKTKKLKDSKHQNTTCEEYYEESLSDDDESKQKKKKDAYYPVYDDLITPWLCMRANSLMANTSVLVSDAKKQKGDECDLCFSLFNDGKSIGYSEIDSREDKKTVVRITESINAYNASPQLPQIALQKTKYSLFKSDVADKEDDDESIFYKPTIRVCTSFIKPLKPIPEVDKCSIEKATSSNLALITPQMAFHKSLSLADTDDLCAVIEFVTELYHPTGHRTFVVPATGAVLLPSPSPPLAAPFSVFPIVPQVPPLPHNSDFLQSSAISNNINTFPMQQRSSLEDARMFHTTLPPPPTTTTALFGVDSLNKSDIDQYLAYVESDSDCRALRVDDRRPNNNSLYMLIGEITNVKVNFTSESAIFKGFSTFNKLKPIDLTSTKINELKRIQLIKWSI